MSREKEAAELFANSKKASGVYSEEQVRSVPDPVRRYFRYALNDPQNYISTVSLKHTGQFRFSEKWMSIKGQEYFTVDPPAFLWFGKVRFFSAKDSFLRDRGNLKVKLFSLIPIMNAEGEKMNQSELLRWLSETPWFPTALIPSKIIEWVAVNKNSAKAILRYKKLKVEGIFYFNEKGQAIKFQAKRYKDNALEDWTGYYSDYRKVQGMHVPFFVEVEWNLKKRDFKYVKFRIDKIKYDMFDVKDESWTC